MGVRDSKRIAYYITPHGYGHAVRSLEVVRVLLQAEPDLEVMLVGDAPPFLILESVGRPLPQRRRHLDVGLIQLDNLRFDLEATRLALESLRATSADLIAEEVEFLCENRVGLVVSDIAFLPIVAAARAKIPAVGLGNFTWDWIYAAYAREDPRWDPLVAWIRECYHHCGLFLQLPMHGDSSACPRVVPVPLVTRKANRPPEETRRLLGWDGRRRGYLLSFTALELGETARRRVEAMDEVILFHKYPLGFELANGCSANDLGLTFPSLVAAVDGVITKPGYGIVADCLAHSTPMVYTDRGDFAEYQVLVRDLEALLTAVHIPRADLYAGLWQPAIERLQKLPRRRVEIPCNGAQVVADHILRAGGWR